MADRLPPGQRWIDAPLVYDIGPVPSIDLSAFRLAVAGAVESPLLLSWDEVLSLPCTRLVRDVHCVTSWSVRDVVWEGVRVRELVDRVLPSPDVRWVTVRGRDGYATSIPLEDFARPDSLLAYRMNGLPLAEHHGHPLRLVVPALYAWKSAKYVERIEFSVHIQRGFWEERGYHDRGDPWREERYRI